MMANFATTVAVIGTAGRGEDAKRMTKSLFDTMVECASNIITRKWGLEAKNVCLVSGGAAWADHIAVRLYLSGHYRGLTLHLPAKWTGKGYAESGTKYWRTDPGFVSNNYHRRFSSVIGTDTLAELELARAKGAQFVATYQGFHGRNTAVALSHRILAFTWGEGSEPKEGGTKDTWNKAGNMCQRWHQPLRDLVVSVPNHHPIVKSSSSLY